MIEVKISSLRAIPTVSSRGFEAQPAVSWIEGPVGQIHAIQEISEGQTIPYVPPPSA